MKQKINLLALAMLMISLFSCKKEDNVKTFTKENLTLTYNGVTMNSASIKLNLTTNTIDLYSIIPGVPELTIPGLTQTGGETTKIEGQASMTDGSTVKVNGTITGVKLNLSVGLTVTNDLTGVWSLASPPPNGKGPLTIHLAKEGNVILADLNLDVSAEEFATSMNSELLHIAGLILRDINFGTDGFLQAEYTTNFQDFILSPKGAVSYYTVGDVAYLFPHLNTVTKTSPNIMEEILIKGIPLKYKKEAGAITLTIPQELLAIALPLAKAEIAKIPVTDPMYEIIMTMGLFIDAILQCDSYSLDINLVVPIEK